MTRDELIALVTNTLAIASQRGDVPIIEICTELGARLVNEVEPPAEAPPTLAEAAPVEPPSSTDCPVCAARRARRNAVQQRHRKKKRGGVSAKAIAQDSPLD